MIKPLQEYFNLREAAEYLGIGYSQGKVDWPGWKKWGCVPVRYGKALKFKKSQLDRMMEIRSREIVFLRDEVLA